MNLLKNLKELSKDSLYYGLSSVLSQVVSLILVPFYTKELDPETYGIILMLSVVITFMIPISGLSLDGGFIRYFSYANSIDREKYFSTSLFLKLIGLFLTTLIVFTFFNYLNELLFDNKLDSFFKFYIILLISFESLNFLFFSYLRVLRKVEKILVVNLISLGIGLFFSILLVLVYKYGLYGAVGATFIGVFSKFILLSFTVLKKKSYKFSVGLSKKLLNYSLPKIPHKIFGFVIAFSTTLFINETLGLVSAGIYFVAAKLSKPLNLITNVFQQSWVPYRLEVHKMKDKEKLFAEISYVYINALLFLWLILSIYCTDIYYLLIDPRYYKGVEYVPLITLVPISNAFYYMYITGYELHSNQTYIMFGSFIVSLLQIVLCYLFMDVYAPYNFIAFNILSFILLAFFVKIKSNEIVRYKFYFIRLLLYFSFNLLIIYIVNQYNFTFFPKTSLVFLSTIIFIVTSYNFYKNSKIND